LLRRIFRSKTDETIGWRKLYNEELHNLYSSLNIITMITSRRMSWTGYVASMRENRNAYRNFVDKPEGRRPLERPGLRWDDNTKMGLREVGWGKNYMHLVQDRDQ
jgi:hypothetical protein